MTATQIRRIVTLITVPFVIAAVVALLLFTPLGPSVHQAIVGTADTIRALCWWLFGDTVEAIGRTFSGLLGG